MTLVAQADIARLLLDARVEAVRGRTEQMRQLLETAESRCEKNGKAQSKDCIQVLFELSEIRAGQSGLRTFPPDADPVIAGEAAMRRGFRQVLNKQFDDAITSFVAAERRDPNQAARSAIWIAIANTRNGKHDEAERHIQTALAKAEGQQATTFAYVAAMLYHEMGRGDEAAALRKRVPPVAANARPAPPEGTFRVGGGVTAPSLVEKFEPRYSEEARAAKYQGAIVLSLVVGEAGYPRDVRVLRGLGMGLDERAVAAVSAWRFKPGMKDGMAVPVFATVEVNFKLL